MVDSRDLYTSNNMHMQCLWFSFHKVLNELSQVRSNWNTHYIRKSRYQTMAGIPEKLYFLPEEVGSKDYKKPFNPADVREAEYEVHSVDTDHSDDEDDEENETSDYQRYFNYALQTLGIDHSTSWRESLHVYRTLLSGPILVCSIAHFVQY